MKVVIPGGSGQVGALLAGALTSAGHEVVVLGRSPTSVPGRWVAWDGKGLDAWVGEIDGADVLINLAGRSVDCRYTARNRQEILASRIDSTRVLGEVVHVATRPPRVWLQSSTATIYAHRYDAANDEQSGLLGGAEPDLPDKWRFSIDVARGWEDAARDVAIAPTRLVLLRSSLILSPRRGGVFDTLLGLVRHGLGGTAGSGRQYVSWIHHEDFLRAVQWLIDHEDLAGPVNLAAPNPVPNRAFMGALRAAWGVPIGLPANRWMLEAGALTMRTETELILKSRRVVPGRLSGSGFTFEHPDWPGAARDLCRQWRAIR